MEHVQGTNDERLVTVARGATAGIIAGTIFGLSEMAAAAIASHEPLLPVKMAASVWLAHSAFSAGTVPVVLCGAVIHYLIAIAFGVIGALLYEWTDWSRHMRLGVVPMVSIGALYGVFVWLINLDVIAGSFLPWIWRAHQPAQLLLHAVFYGIPVGVSLVGLAVSSRNPPDVVPLRLNDSSGRV